MKLLVVFISLVSFASYAAKPVPKSVQCIKKELAKGQSMEKAYQKCSVKK
jgi:hypothetical protein